MPHVHADFEAHERTLGHPVHDLPLVVREAYFQAPAIIPPVTAIHTFLQVRSATHSLTQAITGSHTIQAVHSATHTVSA